MADKAENVLDDIAVVPGLVIMDLQAETNQDAIKAMSSLLFEQGYVKESYIEAVKEREKVFYTGLGFEELGVALPHTDAVHVIHQAIAIGILKKPVAFKTMGELDGTVDVKLMFMLAINKPDKQLDFLSSMIDSCQKPGKLLSVYNASAPEEAVELFKGFFKKEGNDI
ncbi:PTS sugar transporter subunit IIA [Lacrimispora sp.]|uniref:PTS sugar transporter subunit IIA n=1 Tax=Lacrimispora sp. TaxID=2719234 RepID=UPI0028B134CA|nr:PTS sugar transporter subunit IIA [Lacrimispora sp.]